MPDLLNVVILRATEWIGFAVSRQNRQVVYGFILGLSLSIASTSIAYKRRRKRLEASDISDLDSRPIELRSNEVISSGLTGLIGCGVFTVDPGNTPLVRINSLSNVLGVEILGKAEYLNPGGSVKDRVALRIVDDAERLGFLHPHTGSRIFEGTMGSTGISIATVARARHVFYLFPFPIIMPDDVAEDKIKALQVLGADVELVRPASIVDKKQFVNLARQRAAHFGESELGSHPHLLASSSSSVVVSTSPTASSSDSLQNDGDHLRPRGYFADQFENMSNYNAHFESTGPEIWRQTNGHVDAFVSGAGTIAGIGRYIKIMDENVVVALADPEGSGLYNKVSVKYGVLYNTKESEGTKRRHQVDTIVEGIGINRLTKNMALALPIIDDAYRVTDEEAVSMSRYLVQHDGLFLGSTSACNLLACVKLVKERQWKQGQVIVTILCDSGSRHYTKFWNDEYLARAGILNDSTIVENLLQQ
ncbi:PALP-domain-containing protein [Fistulina hepatica ATCC 64428]|uniref:cysteine synthase n=1 Tax=Fistulina hepatica ATCC 64428 TaxID=1128425 RepID=A0A0D7A0J5_9AGAR|nr:PALP-domain-containing protein [Fistulina hepatica ATCC 64428]